MSQCKVCKKKGLFLRTNQYGVCATCWEKYQLREQKKKAETEAYNKKNLFVSLSYVPAELDLIMDADSTGNTVSISDTGKTVEVMYNGVLIGKVKSKDIDRVREFIKQGYQSASITCEDSSADAVSNKSGYIVELHIEK